MENIDNEILNASNGYGFEDIYKVEGKRICTDDLEKRELCSKECANIKCKNNESYYNMV